MHTNLCSKSWMPFYSPCDHKQDLNYDRRSLKVKPKTTEPVQSRLGRSIIWISTVWVILSVIYLYFYCIFISVLPGFSVFFQCFFNSWLTLFAKSITEYFDNDHKASHENWKHFLSLSFSNERIYLMGSSCSYPFWLTQFKWVSLGPIKQRRKNVSQMILYSGIYGHFTPQNGRKSGQQIQSKQ